MFIVPPTRLLDESLGPVVVPRVMVRSSVLPERSGRQGAIP